MKRWLSGLLAALTLFSLTACGASAQDSGRTVTEGRLLLSANGTALLVTEDGTPIALSVQADGDDPFSGFSTGDRVSVTHDSALDESYPLQTGAYEWTLLEQGSLEDIPEETLTSLEDLGGDFGRDLHAPAAEPQTVADSGEGYCGNTITQVLLDGETYAFWGDDSVRLTDLLLTLDYADGVCRCQPEFTVNTEFGEGYGVNLTDFYVRYGERQCPITEEQAAEIREILDRNCPGDG